MKNAHYFPLLTLVSLLFMASAVSAQPYPLRAQTLSVYNQSTSVFNNYDSVWYYYSEGRGGSATTPYSENVPDYYSLGDDNVKYDSAIRLYQQGAPSYSKVVNTYDVAGHVLTATYMYTDSSGAWVPDMFISRAYSGDNNTFELVKVWDGAMWQDAFRTTQFFNAHNDLDTIIEEQNGIFTGFVWGNAKRLLFSYDTAYHVTSVVIQNPLGIDWDNFGRYTFAYDMDGNQVERMVYTWMSDTSGMYYWHNIERGESGYNSTHDQVADTLYWLGDSTAGTINVIDSNVFDTSHNMIMSVKWLPDTATSVLEKVRKYEWTYNAYGQCTSIASNTWNATTGSWGLYTGPGYTSADYMRRYYYSATPSTPGDTTHSVDHAVVVNNMAAEVRAYPSPARDFVTLDITMANAQPFKVSLYDMQGQLIERWSEAAAKQYKKTVSVGNLPAGNYFFKITCSGASRVRSFVVVH